MLVNILNLSGEAVSVEAGSLVRVRPSYGHYEPQGAVFVDVASGGVFSSEGFQDLVSRLSAYVRLAHLHSPAGAPVALNADAVAAVVLPDPARHHEDARSVATLKPAFINPANPGRAEQQLLEAPADATDALNSAIIA